MRGFICRSSLSSQMPKGSPFSSRSECIPLIRSAYTCRGQWKHRVPIVYCEEYNISAYGLDKLHPLDAAKFGKIVTLLEAAGICKRSELPSPVAASDDDLREIHSDEFIQKLKKSKLYICQIVEMPLLFLIPKFLLDRRLVMPCRFHLGGTILAMALAIERGWAINLGGGMHHSRRDHSEGWCFFADISIGIKKIRRATENRIQKVLYIDCDVHQGNGVERDKLHFDDNDLFILDVYNSDVWPGDYAAEEAIDVAVPLHCGTTDEAYLERLQNALKAAGKLFKPDLIVYNAGTDILVGDTLGQMQVSPKGVLQRDEMVFQHAADVAAPIVMLLSGGYTKFTHKVIADSIVHLSKKFNLL